MGELGRERCLAGDRARQEEALRKRTPSDTTVESSSAVSMPSATRWMLLRREKWTKNRMRF